MTDEEYITELNRRLVEGEAMPWDPARDHNGRCIVCGATEDENCEDYCVEE